MKLLRSPTNLCRFLALETLASCDLRPCGTRLLQEPPSVALESCIRYVNTRMPFKIVLIQRVTQRSTYQ